MKKRCSWDRFALDIPDKSADALIFNLERSGCRASLMAEDALRKSHQQTGAEERGVVFTVCWVKKLGFKKGEANIRRILERIRELGHYPCKPGDAPILRACRETASQKESQVITLMTEPMQVEDKLFLFTLCCSEGMRRLRVRSAPSYRRLNKRDFIIFRRGLTIEEG